MFRRFRLRRIHARFLESCRNLKEGRDYWGQVGPITRWFAKVIVPIPLLGLQGEGQRILEALDWLEDRCKQQPLSEDTIREYHRVVYPGDDEMKGAYRRHDLKMEGLRPAPPQKIGALMKQLCLRLAGEQRDLDGANAIDKSRVLRLGVETYHRIGVIHPFPDANGRVARLSMNHLLRRYEVGYVILPSLSDAPPLWRALLEASQGNLECLLDFARACEYRI